MSIHSSNLPLKTNQTLDRIFKLTIKMDVIYTVQLIKVSKKVFYNLETGRTLNTLDFRSMY